MIRFTREEKALKCLKEIDGFVRQFKALEKITDRTFLSEQGKGFFVAIDRIHDIRIKYFEGAI